MTDTDTKHQAETWTYAGARLSGGKRTGAWADPEDGRLRYWTDARSFVVGGRYTLRIERRDDGKVFRLGDPAPTGQEPATGEQVTAWEIEDEKTRHHLNRERAERKLKANGSGIDRAAEGVCDLARQVKTFTELEVLVAAVRRRMMDAWDGK